MYGTGICSIYALEWAWQFGEICSCCDFHSCEYDRLARRISGEKEQSGDGFGKFMDPIADKLLVCSAMICLVEKGALPAWIVIIIIGREFIISGFRLVASDKGVVIAASYWGKFKTVSQMLMVILLILDLGGVFHTIAQVLMWIALVLTVVSLADYMVKNRSVLSGDM